MFYGRPAIEALRWDLTALPIPDGSRNFAAVTSDGRPVDLRFSSGWLTVERGEAGASPDSNLDEVLSMPISPFGVVDISPEQLCDILGLTVRGEAVIAPDHYGMRGFDWSGRTISWSSTHRMLATGDAEVLTAAICDAVGDVVLLQPVWEWQPPRVRCRSIRFLMASDEIVTFAVGLDPSRLAKLREADEIPLEEFDRLLDPRIDLWRSDRGENLTGADLIRRRAPALGVDYEVIPHRRYQLSIKYRTADPIAHTHVSSVLRVLDRHMCRGLDVVDLETGAVLRQDREDEEDTRSYSVRLRDWCLERPNRFISVEVRREGSREQYVGYRPLSGAG